MDKPYKELQITKTLFLRTFSSEECDEFVWHRDVEDRYIIPFGTTDWLFQMDNELPKTIKDMFIPKETYHRIIKGNGDLTILVYKILF